MTDTSPSYLDDKDKAKQPGQPGPRHQPGGTDQSGNQKSGDEKGGAPPPAGPHDRKELTDPLKTPGAGTLPDADDDVESPTG